MRYYSAKVDTNQAEIVKALRKLGAFVLPIHRLKNCCDLVVLHRGRVIMAEVKNLDGKGAKLSAGEHAFRYQWQANGGEWALLTSTDDAKDLLEHEAA